MKALLPVAAGGIALWAFSGEAGASVPDSPEWVNPGVDTGAVDDFPVINYDAPYTEFSPFEPELMTPSNPIDFGYVPNTGDANLNAVLKLIRVNESGDDFTKLVGGGNFIRGFKDHPAITGEFKGISLGNGLISTAAGAYQITRTTWKDLGGIGKYGDFGPTAQQRAAIDLIVRRKAMDAVLAGDMEKVRTLLMNEWEFFQKPAGSLAKVASSFQKYGGIIV